MINNIYVSLTIYSLAYILKKINIILRIYA
nr:MAG TPA: hypothetical protein [Bacteriophage sp.]